MKARSLILDDNSSTESRAAASRGRPTREAGSESNMVKEKEAPAGKGPRTFEVRSTPVEPSRAIRKDKGKAVLTEKVSPRQDEVPSAGIKMRTPRKRITEVLLLLQYLDRKREKYAGAIIIRSYVEILRKSTRIKVAVASAVAVKERQNQSTETRYQVLQKRLAEEIEKRRYSEKAYEGLCEDVERTKYVTVNLLSRLEACQTAFNAESLRVDELTAAAEKEQEYDTELAARAKKLAEYEAARISDLELIEKLEARCNKLWSQRTQAEEQLCNMETRLTEAEGMNQQLSE
ncbi:hypothetical protein AXG93_3841s1020 [Marchantia polymorpha subsp. ruderalis]|uniref:Uncharacterized protein n=1 Tax=Marchantia polymorpha subsp. ruderalis TaxID=1480154 RepID=A0A176W116_MARPO|nr:hypothetical protein AXG93_3841s1020 [Marchantia polymorpha subsp. ruderalis]